MRETKITAFLLGATILSSMGLSVPAFATSTNDIVDWIFIRTFSLWNRRIYRGAFDFGNCICGYQVL